MVPFPFAIIIIPLKVKKSIGQKEKLFIEGIFGKQGAADTAYTVYIQLSFVIEDEFFESSIYLFDSAAQHMVGTAILLGVLHKVFYGHLWVRR